jgi:predicted dehydrogenase
MLKVALVGVGNMGSSHFNLYRKMDDVEIVALVDVEDFKITGKAKECGARAYTDLNEMLQAEQPDFVDICTPSYIHAAQAITVMSKGIHVITEKPAALNADDIRAMYKCAADNGVFLMVAHVLRFWQEYIWLKDAVDNNTNGKLLQLDMWRIGVRPLTSWQGWMLVREKSGLVPFDLHIHDIDFMVYLLGAPDETETRQIYGSAGHHTETCCRYNNGTRVQAKAAWYNGHVPFQMGYSAIFEEGYAEYRADVLTYYPNDKPAVKPVEEAALSGSEINVANMSAYYRELRYFMDCIRKNEKPSMVREEELIAAVSLLNRFDTV